MLKEGEADTPVTELCRKYGISNTARYQWKSKHSSMQVSKWQRLSEPETENAKLKRRFADLALECGDQGCSEKHNVKLKHSEKMQ